MTNGNAPSHGVVTVRLLALAASIMAAVAAAMLFFRYGSADGLDAMDWVRSGLILISTWWLAWGAVQGLLGLTTRPAAPDMQGVVIRGRTVILVPVYNEDPTVTFARIAAMDASVKATGVAADVHFAILSDTRKDDVAEQERLWFLRLLSETGGQGRIFYRRRAQNTGKKAGNIEEFIQTSGGAYDFALILDADSLMEGATIVEMIRRMEAEPRLGLLQTLPKVIRAQSVFGRIQQFSASFYSPIFARGLAMMAGRTGPFWGHNAMVRVRAFAESCGLPELRGKPPFGGHVLSHDYVEAALLARAGWIVRLDDDLEGSFEEGPENIVDHAKRDRRWCQGNLQHSRLVAAPGLKPWSRFVFVQGIFAYIAPLFWLGFIAASIAAPSFAPPPDYFPEPHWSFPIFPSDATSKAIGLAIGIFGLLLLPKLLIVLDAWGSGRARGFGGGRMAMRSTLSELLLSSVTAPVFLMFSTRSVMQVLFGRDGGWPPNNRGDGSLTLGEGWAASSWITTIGLILLAGAWYLAPGLLLWLLPVALPMIAAPWIIHRTSLPQKSRLYTVPQDLAEAPVVALHDEVLARWTAEGAPEPGPRVAVAAG
ncbi:MAG: glucans biosynthesis glucosyltransferase MdoH [Paracoccaceae bacterium]